MSHKNKIIALQDYKTRLADIQKFNEQVQTDRENLDKERYLYSHNALLKLQAQGFPLLLQEGDARVFDAPPVNAYLLPPLADTDERWLLVFFVTKDESSKGEKSWVQLWTWHTSEEKTTITPLAGQEKQVIDNCNHRLDKRPGVLEFVPTGKGYTISLTFSQGELTVTANATRGIRTADWDDIESKDDTWIERYSFGNMETAIKIRRYGSGHWQDDVVEDGNLLSNDAKPGRIRGADGAKGHESFVYLASNQDCIYRLDKRLAKQIKQIPTQSESLYNEVLDILALPWSDNDYVLLAAVRNGMVYLLHDDTKTISIKHWQHTGSPIWRLIGRGDKHILSLDDRQTLLPLRLNDPDTLKNAQNKATESLAELYCTELQNFLNDSSTLLENDPEKFIVLGQLALEIFLRELDNKQPPSLDISYWTLWLNEAYETATAKQQKTLIRLHQQLIKRVIRRLQVSCVKEERVKFEPAMEALLEIFRLTPYAPDVLWISLFRHYDWFRLWAEETGVLGQDNVEKRLSQFEREFNQQRLNFAFGLGRIRPLNATGSFRLLHQATHLDRIDDSRIALIEANRDLHVLQVNPLGTNWERKLRVKHGVHWQGQAQFVRTLPASGNKPLRFLIGTLRGELVLLEWDGQNARLVKKIDCGFAVQSSLRLEAHGGYLLLGGRNASGNPCLYGLPATGDLNQLSSSPLWQDKDKDKDKDKGTLSVLRSSKEGKQLWAINRDTGKLYCWQINSLHHQANPPFLLGTPKVWLNSIHKLHALQYSEQDRLVVSGGDGGLVTALNADDGTTRWVVNCEGNVRHIAYLNHKDKRVWLLCSDEGSSLMVDNEGCVTGVIENTGSVSAVKVIGNSLLLASTDGRLLWMQVNEQSAELFNPPASGWGAYPVRITEDLLSSETLCEILKFESEEINNDKKSSDLVGRDAINRVSTANRVSTMPNHLNEINELLTKMMILRLVAIFLQSNSMDSELSQAFYSFWSPQNLARKIVFLYWLRDLCLDNKPREDLASFTLKHLNKCWDELPAYDHPNLLCKLISPMLDILDKLVKSENPLRQTITDCLWQSNESHQHDHCAILRKGDVLLAIQSNQVLKRWRDLANSPTDEQRLFDWCNKVAEQTDITETEPLRELLQRLLAQGNFRLLSIGHSWQNWLISLVTETDSDAPEPLACLQEPGEQSLTDKDYDALSKLFSDNTAWQNWVNNLKNVLSVIRTTRQEQPHKAWAERKAWRRLHEHFVYSNFTVARQQVLLALWWGQVSQRWADFINLRLDELTAKVHDYPELYLDIELQDRWHSSHKMSLNLSIASRFPVDVKLKSIVWGEQTTDHNNYPDKLPSLLAEGKKGQYSVTLTTKEANQFVGSLILNCKEADSGYAFSVSHDINIRRNLSQFSSDPQWTGTWQRLEKLLLAHDKQKFYWVDGDVWTSEERELLKQDVKDKYGLSVDEDLKPTEELTDVPAFSPDLALDATPQVRLEQVHALLLPWLGAEDKVRLALALWRDTHDLPERIDVALSDLPKPAVVTELMKHLLGSEEKVEALKNALSELPARAVGAWCANEPFYALKPEEADLAEAVYLPAASLLSAELWVLLDNNTVEPSDLATLLDNSTATAEQQRKDRKIFQAATTDLFTGVVNQRTADKAAQCLLGKLGIGSPSYEQPVWCLETALTLNWQDFNRVYLLPKSSATERSGLKSRPEGLWLCLGEKEPPTDLKGMAIALNQQQALALLHTENPNEALLWLNRMVRTRHIKAGLAFRDAVGLGDLVGRHFKYRDKEIEKLWACLDQADSPTGSGSALIIGGRRVGKTCLRERILYEIKQKQAERVCLFFDFQGESELDKEDMHGTELEYWFFKQLEEKLKKENKLWDGGFKLNLDKRDVARNELRKYLKSLKKKTGHAVLFIFDETDYLVKADTRSEKKRYALFSFFRSLMQDGLICWIATSYPFGSDQPDALNIANHDATGPIYNTFPDPIKLTPWLPKDAWDYLQERLAGFGVLLPRHYRDDVITISCGVPWIIHAFGFAVCDSVATMATGTKIVNTRIWQAVRKTILSKIYKDMKESVRSAAERQDALSKNVNAETALSQGRLWMALNNLARKQALPIRRHDDQWPACLGFKVSKLKTELPQVDKKALREVLIRLAASPVLEGDDTDGDHYIFANNLLPVYLHYSNGDNHES